MKMNFAGIDIAGQLSLILTVVLVSTFDDVYDGRYPFLALGLWQVVSAAIR